MIQSHLKKLFAGIHSVQFDDENQHILAMRSLDGELVPLGKKIRITSAVEEWLKELSKEMVSTLQQSLLNALQESKKQLGQLTVEKYPSQVQSLIVIILNSIDKRLCFCFRSEIDTLFSRVHYFY